MKEYPLLEKYFLLLCAQNESCNPHEDESSNLAVVGLFGNSLELLAGGSTK